MSLKNLFNNFFSYAPENNYEFSISENSHISDEVEENNYNFQKEKKVNIFPNLLANIDYIKTRYNILINSDVIFREFTMNAYGKQYDAFLLYIDGMVDSKMMNDFILKPLMLRNKSNLYDGTQNKIISESTTINNVTIRKVKKFDLPNYLMGCLLPQNSVKQVLDFDAAANAINSRELCTIY